MKNIIILLLSIIAAYSFEQDLTNHKGLISNGVQYDPKEFPYVVKMLIYVDDTKMQVATCTGSLIREDFVLTAAHCLYNQQLRLIEVYPGPSDKNDFVTVAKMYVKKEYESAGQKISDLGLLKLKKPFPQVKKFIEIGGHPDEFKNDTALNCTNIGFGAINKEGVMGEEGRRMETKVKHGPRACKGNPKQWREYLCSNTGTRSMTCGGDSGGPMICNGKLYGACHIFYNFSWGANVCGEPDVQSAHMFLYRHLKWINNIIDPKKKKKDKKKKNDKKKNKKKNSGNSLKPHLTMYTILAIVFCIVY